MFLIGFPILSQPIRPHSSTSIEYTKTWQAKPIKFITKLYPDHNNLWIKHATHQKAESLRAGFLSKLENTVNNNSISNTKYAEFSTEWNVLLNYRSHTCVYNHLFNLHQESVPLLQSTFTSLFHPYLFTKLSLQSPVTLPSSYLRNFSSPYFCLQPSQQLLQKYFPYLSPLANSGCMKGPGSEGVFGGLTHF